jgi:hypothetical protein
MEVSVTAFYDDASGFHGHVQMYIDGAWRYDMITIDSTGIFRYNMSAYSGMSATWMFFVLDGASSNDYYSADYFAFYVNDTTTTYTRAQYGYSNDMSNTSWVDDTIYCSVTDNGADMLMEDNEGTYYYGIINDTGISVDLAVYPYVYIHWDEGSVDVTWTNITISLRWSNGTIGDLWYQQVINSSGTEDTLYALDLCDSENTTIIEVIITCWGDGDVGDDVELFTLNMYDTMWKTQTVEVILTGETFTGMLLAGVSLVGLVMIPAGTTLGALMVKSKKLNESNWLIPLAIVLLGFAFFIGGMA